MSAAFVCSQQDVQSLKDEKYKLVGEDLAEGRQDTFIINRVGRVEGGQ